ncbi:MAG: phosphodiester glycosidase family protein, partial [Lentisphaeria bacterium]|nr:phosphodiester glycosidase family protein [Lentisphaeria bacterium]
INRKTKKIVLLVGDGRFPKQAPGLNLYSSCYFLKIMGCDEALTIDGGGSCQMLIKKGKKLELQNYPSDNGQFDHDGARRVHSCIYLIKGGKKDK